MQVPTYGNRLYGIFIPKNTHPFLKDDSAIFLGTNTSFLLKDYPSGWSGVIVSFIATLPEQAESSNFINTLQLHCKNWCDQISRQYVTQTNNFNQMVFGATVTVGFYMQNGPRGEEVKLWSSSYTEEDGNCGNCYYNHINEKEVGIGTKIEPSYFLGSFTKPITAALVVNGLYNLYKKKGIKKDFFSWFSGDETNKAVSFNDIYELTSHFKDGISYTDNMASGYGSVGYPGAPVARTMADFLYNCDKDKDSNCKGIYCPCSRKGCDLYLNTSSDKVCINDGGNMGLPLGAIQDPSNYQQWLHDLTPYDLIMMRGGIPDADTLGIDNYYQKTYRTHPFGPIEFIYEWNGFNREPGSKCGTSGDCANNSPPDAYKAEYSSSGFTLAGVLLYLLHPNS